MALRNLDSMAAHRGHGTGRAVHPVPSLENWVAEFRRLHDGTRDRYLEPEECRWYEAARRQLARLLLNAQQMSREFGHTARQTFRIAWALQIELALDDGPVRAATVDISTGGFSVLLGAAPVKGEEIEFSLRLQRTQSIRGVARIVAAVEKAEHVRVSCAFSRVAADDVERLETFLFDKVISHLGAAGAPCSAG